MPEILEGPPALSEFRRQALLDRCREICPAIGGLSVNLLYMVGFLEAPDGELRQRLRRRRRRGEARVHTSSVQSVQSVTRQ